MNTVNIDGIELFNSMYPNFFESVKNLPEDAVYEEMLLPLGDRNFTYKNDFGEDISFGFYNGEADVLREAIEKVDKDWVQFFDGGRVYCGYCGGKIASFCLVDDMGEHDVNGRTFKVGGPGCVGTVPEFRRKGIGLVMVARVTEILADEGFDVSYIHYTGVADWYAKLGYMTFAKWGKNGFIGNNP